MCVAHLAEQIEAHVGDGAGSGVRVRWAHEGEKLLGTAGAIRAALEMLAPAFLVTYGDSYLPFDYAEPLRILAAHDDCDGVMSVYRNEGQWDASNVVMDASGAWVLRYEKGRSEPEFDHIDYGATALRREIIAALPPGQPAGLDAIQRELSLRKRLRACVARERFFEIGSPEGLAELDRHLRTRAPSCMIVSRAPVRFSLGGGGTDLPSYAREHGGFVVAASVDKFVFVCVARRFAPTIRLAYSESEIVDSVDQIKHRIFRAALQMTGLTNGLELHSLADVPANTGLGSSSSFTVALLNGLHAFKREFVPAEQLAREACKLEIELLKEPIGKQDQYIAAYGGITALTFNKDGSVDVERLPLREEVLDDLESNLIIYYSGVERSASAVLKEQAKTIVENKDAAVQRMHRIKELGFETKRILLSGEIDKYGEMLHEHWTNKRKMAANMADSTIDEHYDAARKAGAIGGKLMGAGGGGFFMFYARATERRRLHEAMSARGLRPMRFRFDFDGARIVANFHRS